MSRRFAAVDIGASSGRVMIGTVEGEKLSMRTAARFANRPLRLPDGLHWNLPDLYTSVLAGLESATSSGDLISVGVDAWAVDHALLRRGRMLELPYHYRDEQRSVRGPALVHAMVGRAELFYRNGLQDHACNTLYQLAADQLTHVADRMLLVPDLIGYWLTGATVAERTNASTTGLLDVVTREWDTELATSLGFVHLLPSLVNPGDELGPVLPHVAEAIGGDLQVLMVGSHDTASAVVGTPLSGDRAAYVSLGTWALAGLELDAPVLSEEARVANFTNEGGVDGTVRFLTNVMGTWLLSETLRSWGEVDLAGLLAAAEGYDGDVSLVDVQDARFVSPNDQHSDMESRIAAWCVEHDVPLPRGRAAVVRCIVLSIAAAIAEALARAADLAGRRVDVVHVVGGGAQNAFLCRAIAERAGLPVLAGPVEATAIGNVLVQARGRRGRAGAGRPTGAGGPDA